MSSFDNYRFLLQLLESESRLLHERVVEFLAGNAILVAGWAGILTSEKWSESALRNWLPVVGIIIGVMLGIVLFPATRSIVRLHEAMRKVEEGSDFCLMAEKKTRPLTDIWGVGRLRQANVAFYAFSIGLPIIAICVWFVCLLHY